MDRPRARLEAFLAWKKWTQAEAAKALDLHQTAVSQILSGARWPGRRVAHAIERATSGWPEGPIRSVEWDEAEDAQRAAEGVIVSKAG